MICKEEVFLWFKNLRSAKRMEVMHGLLNMCMPMELRFVGSCLEDLCKKDFLYLRDAEHRANTASEVSKSVDLSDHVNRSRLAIHLALLHSTNRICSNVIFNTLSAAVSFESLSKCGGSGEDVDDDDDDGGGGGGGAQAIADEILLLLTLAFYHPAFTFEQKEVLGSRLKAALNYYQLCEETYGKTCSQRVDLCCNRSNSSSNSSISVGLNSAPPAVAANCPVSQNDGGCAHEFVTPATDSGGGNSNNNSNQVATSAAVTTTTVSSSGSGNSSSGSSNGVTSTKYAAELHSPRGSITSRSPSLPNVPYKAHIKHLELKGTPRRKKAEKRIDYKIQVTWANGEVTEVVKSHLELCNFHQQLLHFLSDDGNVHRQDRLIPYFTGPKQLVGNRTEELTEESISRMADYLRQLMVKVPHHILASELVTSFFRLSSSDSPAPTTTSNSDTCADGGSGNGQATSVVTAGSTSLTSTQSVSNASALPTSSVQAHVHQPPLSHFSSSSSLSSASSVSLPSSPPPSAAASVHSADGVNNPALLMTTVAPSQCLTDVTSTSHQLKSLTIYNSLCADSQSAAGTPPSPATRQANRRQSPKLTWHTTCGSVSEGSDDFVGRVFHKEKLKRVWDQLRNKYTVKEIMNFGEDDFRREGISGNKVKQIMKIFDSIKYQAHNGVATRQVLDFPNSVAAGNFHYPQSALLPIRSTPQSGLHSSGSTVHTCQTQVLMPAAPVDLVVRYSVPTTTTAPESLKPALHSVGTLHPSHSLCNGEVHVAQQAYNRGGDVVDAVPEAFKFSSSDAAMAAMGDVSKESRFRRGDRAGSSLSGGGTCGMKVGPKVSSSSRTSGDVAVRRMPEVSSPMSSSSHVVASDEDLLYEKEARTSSSSNSSSNSSAMVSECFVPAQQPLSSSLGWGLPPPNTYHSAEELSQPNSHQHHQHHHQQQQQQQTTRKLSPPYSMHQQVPLTLSAISVQHQQQSRVHHVRAQSVAPATTMCHTCPCTRASATPPPVPQPPPPSMPFSFLQVPIGGMFSPFATPAGPTFLSAHTNGFVPNPAAMPPPAYQFVHSPDGLDLATYSILQQQQSGGGAPTAKQQRLAAPPPPNVPGFVAGPTPNVGFHGNHQLQPSPTATVVLPGGSALHGHMSLQAPGLGQVHNISAVMSKLTCYNCGQSGHLGPDCAETSLDEFSKPAQFQLSFMPASSKSLDGGCD